MMKPISSFFAALVFAAVTTGAAAQVKPLSLELGGKSEGEPGPRGAPESNMYAAYFRDPDGNKIMVTRLGE